MTGMYLAAAFSSWAPPTWFTSHGGTNGVASDDVVTGTLVMGGGVVVLSAFAMVGTGKLASMRDHPARVAALWSWLLSFATVVIVGVSIELDETYFGAGDPNATGAAKDAIFTWLHQDVGLLLLPTVILLMLVVERLVARRHHGAIAWSAIAGSSILFLGAVVWVLIKPSLHGPGYVISTIGLITIGIALLATLWWDAIGSRPGARPPLLPTRTPRTPTSPHA